MAAVVYDQILTDQADPKQTVYYTADAVADQIEYPTSDTYNIMGPLYLPKIYGKDLTSFELCSSGTIAVTVQDVYSFLLDRVDGAVVFQTTENAPLNLSSGDNASVLIDGQNSNVNVLAANAVSLAAAGSAASIFLDGAASNIVLTASNDVTQTASKDFNIWGEKVYINGKLVSSADASDSLFFGDSNAWIKITDSNMDLYTLNQVHFMMSNNTVYDNAHNFTLTSSNIVVDTTNAFSLTTASALSVASSNTLSVSSVLDTTLTSAQDVSITASVDMNLTTLDGSFTLSAASNASITAGNDLTVVAVGGDASLDVQNGSLAVHAMHAIGVSSETYTEAVSSTYTSAAHDYGYTAVTTFSVAAGTSITADATTAFSATAGDSASLVLDAASSNVTLFSLSNADFGAATQMFFHVSNVTYTLDAVNDKITQVAANIINDAADQFVINAPSVLINDMPLYTAATKEYFLGGDDAWLRIADSNIDMYALNNAHFMMSNNTVYDNAGDFTLTSSNLAVETSSTAVFNFGDTLAVHSDTSITVGSTGSTTVTADVGLALTGTGSLSLSTAGPMTVSSVDSTTTVLGSATSAITASNIQQAANTYIESTVNTKLMSVGSSIFEAGTAMSLLADGITATAAKSATYFAGASNIFAASNTSVTSAVDTVLLSERNTSITAHDSITVGATNAFTLSAPATQLSGSTYSEVYTTSVTSASPLYAYTASNSFSAISSGSMFLKGVDSAAIQTSPTTSVNLIEGNVATHIGGLDVLVVTASNVTINGELRINGDITSITTYEETLEIFDKKITLCAGGSNGVFVDGTANDGSGLIVSGYPSTDGELSGLVQNDILYEKSIKLHCPSAQAMMKLNNPSNIDALTSFEQESYWEVKGGDLRMTLQKTETDFVTFGWRIGAYGELELIKSWSTGGVAGKKIVSKFGRVLDSVGALVL